MIPAWNPFNLNDDSKSLLGGLVSVTLIGISFPIAKRARFSLGSGDINQMNAGKYSIQAAIQALVVATLLNAGFFGCIGSLSYYHIMKHPNAIGTGFRERYRSLYGIKKGKSHNSDEDDYSELTDIFK